MKDSRGSSRRRGVEVDGRPVEVLVCRYNRGFFALCLPCSLSTWGKTKEEVLEKMMFLFSGWVQPYSQLGPRQLCREPEPAILKKVLSRHPQVFELLENEPDRPEQPIRIESLTTTQDPQVVIASLLRQVMAWKEAPAGRSLPRAA